MKKLTPEEIKAGMSPDRGDWRAFLPKVKK